MSTLYTIGHSNRSLSEFLALLKIYEIKQVIDVRTVPKSRHFPWFNKERLKNALEQHTIKYKHIPELGGFRKPVKHSINMGWHNLSFRGFADYMASRDFFYGLKKLNQLIKNKRKAIIMCAEALPWRCHRSLIADAEIIRRIKVLHVMSKTEIKEHQLTPFAVINRNKRPISIYYP